MRGGKIFSTFLLVFALNSGSKGSWAASNPLWASITDLEKAMKLNAFCAKHPRHRRCRDLEKHQAYCAAHPMDAKQCDPPMAGTLLTDCESSKDTDRAFCVGTLDGMLTLGASPQFGTILNLDRPEPTLRCVPAAIDKNPEQLRILFVREAYRHPEVLHSSARRLLYYALAKTYPCPNPLRDSPR